MRMERRRASLHLRWPSHCPPRRTCLVEVEPSVHIIGVDGLLISGHDEMCQPRFCFQALSRFLARGLSIHLGVEGICQ